LIGTVGSLPHRNRGIVARFDRGRNLPVASGCRPNNGAERAADPWGPSATTLEWSLPSPPPFHQFDTLPRIVGPGLDSSSVENPNIENSGVEGASIEGASVASPGKRPSLEPRPTAGDFHRR